ncbi:MAG TPA: LPXTG cell wall anchor domain-containing protein [Anaerolineales bacterium]|nr:LPXTG cell wall anchor domain-containing protein [Anaerolineales bacterium]
MKYRIVVLSLIFLFQSFRVSAHPTEPRLEINTDRIHPGGIIDVRGVGFDYEEVVTLVLISAQGEVPLGELIADTEGIFLYTVVLPADLMEGIYYFRGTTTHHYTISPPLTVQGTALIEGEDEGLREHEDALLAPMPTFPPALVTSAAPAAPAEAPPASNQNWIILAMGALIGISILLGFKRKKQC